MSDLQKRLTRIESTASIKKADWNHFLKNPNELTPLQAQFFIKEKPKLFQKLVDNAIKEMEKEL